MKVMKFGGSSVGSTAMVNRVADIVAAEPGPRAVVASAMSKVTDTILQGLPRVRRDEAEVPTLVGALRKRHEDAIQSAFRSIAERRRAEADVHDLLERLERVLYGIAYTEELTPKTQDLAVSFGERLSCRVLAALLRERKVDSEALDADQIGVVTDGTFGAAVPLLPVIERRLKQELVPRIEKGFVPVITGFFGADKDGHVTTFGRGGSDYSAAILAACTDADVLEVWKDVDGFLTTDPKICADAVPLARMSYEEAAELAYLGAEVLHPRTVEPLKPKRIPVRIRNTGRPEAPGTIITLLTDEDRALRSVDARDGLAILKLYGPGMAYTPGIGKRVFAALGDAGVNVYNMAASQASFALLVNESDVERGLRALEPVVDGIVQDVEAIRGMSLVCIVGQGLGAVPGVAGKIFTAVGAAGVNVEMISVGATDIALNFVVKTADKERAIRILHDAFLVGTKEAL
ncbi:MAG: aspartate kinase [Methanobacteriota archaeon]